MASPTSDPDFLWIDKAVKNIVMDIIDRQGIGDELEQIDDATKKDMMIEWYRIIKKNYVARYE